MTSAPDVPRDGPAEVLVEAVRRRSLRYSRAHVRALLARQERPGSLLALVEAARALGLKATAGEAELETLDALEADELPVLLHFQDAEGGGFGLLEAVTPAGPETPATFRVWDSVHGGRELEREVLAPLWSGVVVLLEPEGPGEPEPRALLHRAREHLLEDWKPRTALAGPSASRGMRAGLVLLLIPLLVGSVAAQAPGVRGATALLALLAVGGGAASLAALAWTRGGAPSFLCGGGGAIDCESVLQSPWARPAGVPLAGLGAAFFGAQALLLGTSAPGGGVAPVWLVAASFLPALPLAGVLVAAQVRMRRFCTLCLGVHATVLTGAAVFFLAPWPGGLTPPAGVLPAALLGGLLFGLLLSTLVPLVSRGSADAGLLEEHARLLRSPLTTLARLAGEPRLRWEGVALGPRLGEASAPHVLTLFAHPACHHCGPRLEALAALVARRRERVRLEVALAPMDPDDAGDVAACEALVAVGLAWGGDVFRSCFLAVKGHFASLRQAEDPLVRVATGVGRPVEQLRAVQDEARARVRAALALKRRHVRGLPTVFLDGRRCEAPPPHIAAWLDPPGLLALLSSPPPRREPSWSQGAHTP